MLGHKDPQQTFADLEAGNTPVANKIFEILRQPPKRWWPFWRRKRS
jgi:hypothetical protein